MVLVEGIQLNGKRITENQIRKAWSSISSQPLPKIKAITLSNADFNQIIDLRRCPEMRCEKLRSGAEFSQRNAQMLAFLTWTRLPKVLNI